MTEAVKEAKDAKKEVAVELEKGADTVVCSSFSRCNLHPTAVSLNINHPQHCPSKLPYAEGDHTPSCCSLWQSLHGEIGSPDGINLVFRVLLDVMCKHRVLNA